MTKPKKVPRQEMPRQAPEERRKNFDEVALGYTAGMAAAEATRCLQCKRPACVAGCPVGIDIPGFIDLIARGDYRAALAKLKEDNVLPAVCGRVCPQEDQCEKECILARKGDPVAIGRLERFAADAWEEDEAAAPCGACTLPEPTGKRIAIVGSGPAGLTAAGDLAKLGHAVTVFEALHKPGGVLVYGIPEFRLPKAIVAREIASLEKLGVHIRTNSIVGRLVTVDELMDGPFDAVFIASGAGLPYFLGIKGENLIGVYSANEFLTRANLMKAYRFPLSATPIRAGKHVAVIGGGNVAMDSARTALRLGAETVTNIYRRSRKEMPARDEEIENAIEEGIRMEFLTNPVEVLGDAESSVRALRAVRMELGEPDASGRARPLPVNGSEFDIAVDTVVVAIGQGPNPLITSTTPGLETDRRGYVLTRDETGKTSRKAVYAGGDIVTGSATVISAMGAGRRVARAIHELLCGKPPAPRGAVSAPAKGQASASSGERAPGAPASAPQNPVGT